MPLRLFFPIWNRTRTVVAWLAIGLLLAVMLLLVLGWWSNASVGAARRALFWAAIVIALALGGLLLAAGRGFFAVLPMGFAAWRFLQGTGLGDGYGRHRDDASQNDNGGDRKAPHGAQMTRQEALEILGLRDGADEDEIRAAYRRMIAKAHPDHGGSDWLAAKVNEAKRVLLDI